MYECIKTKQMDIPRHSSMKKNNPRIPAYGLMQQQTIPDRNSYSDRNIKLGYYPMRGTGNVIQMNRCLNCGATFWGCHCDNYEEDDSGDPSYCENNHEQYLSAPELRKELGARKKSGEAHHIFPGNIVESENLDNNGNDRDEFNDSWNGIMLNGTVVNGTIIHRYNGNAPYIMHRKNGLRGHPGYDRKLRNYIATNGITDMKGCQEHAPTIRELIMNSDSDCLDDM